MTYLNIIKALDIINNQKMIKSKGQTLPPLTANLVIISSVSFSTTPSRALDILIASNGFKRIGFLDSRHIQPAVGYLNDKIQQGALGLPAQVYQKDDVVILQLRSNVRLGRKKQFVAEISSLFKQNIENGSVIIVGSLPYSLRPDLQIQSVSKNIYYHSKGESHHFTKADQNGIIKSLKLLLQDDEQISDVIGEAGFIKNALKSQTFPTFSYLCVFSETLFDHEAAVKLAKSISGISGAKQLSKVEQDILG